MVDFLCPIVRRTDACYSAKSPPPALSTSSTRPSSRADRKIRFAELGPEDVHVYESAPPSPRRKALALPSPSANDSVVSLGKWKGKMLAQPSVLHPSDVGNEPEEGSAEYIRRRFFPEAPANDPNMAWMASSLSSPDPTAYSPRFDLHGHIIPPSLSSTLPTHLGLHHHAEGAHAGYTLDDIFLLSRSTVPAQRTTMLSVLARIANRLSRVNSGDVEALPQFAGKEEDLRKRIASAGVEAMAERGGVGARAIEVIWECIVGWDQQLMEVEGVELQTPGDKTFDFLPMEYLLSQISNILCQGDAAAESLSQLLSILHRLALESNSLATQIVATSKLLTNIVQTFLLTSIPPVDASPLPDPAALQHLATLALSSRSNALVILEYADALLRFITQLPPVSPYPLPLAISLLVNTLRVYTVLASYGLYSHISSTAITPFTQVGQYIVSDACTSTELMAAWGGLLEAWIVCAVDPHQTTPTHDILWSQVVSWGWSSDILELENRLGSDERDWTAWVATWNAQAAWLEGSKINGIRGGEGERSHFVNAVKGNFEDGKRGDVVEGVLDALQADLSQAGSKTRENLRDTANHAAVLTAVIRLWLACLPPHTTSPPPSPPFTLPFPRISEVCAKLVTHPIWSLISGSEKSSYQYVFCRQLSNLLGYYLRLSRRLPEISQDLWMAQALLILPRLIPGDEEFALQTMENVISLMTLEWTTARAVQYPSVIWDRGGLSILRPFFTHAVRPQEDNYIGPLDMTTKSIKLATTQRLPSPASLHKYGLPVRSDWTLTALDHLLRSGDSAVFKALPTSWDSSELEVTRASLLLTHISQVILRHFSLMDFVLSREEAEFGCMKVFMLEHGQPQNDSAEEVFRDEVVGKLVRDILLPYTFGATEMSSSSAPVVPSTKKGDLEEVSTRFLGSSVPFFQYYTDFVALYDAISFSHPDFARLLLPPTSMRYPPDYRKYLWSDSNQVLRTIRTPPNQVLSDDLKEYLYPIETDPELIGAYLRSLLKGSLQEFVRLVALHHLASNIWPDLQEDDKNNEERAERLLKAIVDQGDHTLIREVVSYHQVKSGRVLLPPACFVTGHDGGSRVECIRRWGLAERLEGLVLSTFNLVS